VARGTGVLARSPHGRRSLVSGTYGYLVKITRSPGAGLEDLQLVTRIQVNPRSLPELKRRPQRQAHRS
jgi:hypothetical protein